MDQVPEDLALAPDSPRRPERSRVGVGIRVGRDESRALALRGLERCQDALVDGDVAIETESECVCGEIRILVMSESSSPWITCKSYSARARSASALTAAV